ncbi:lipoprotein [Thermobispora bispora]|uniref:DUF305 domain-containing protein n=1 Tax=Thermobispora bispora (strain ATCC 19993 / DSM 43833 / CBS 139.67 / JCM 10125 / KCTC 9307 / NBRC 14880 / R51) TaxID=469371 RepID=D6Y586_THEBD|nr:DUF305 domain-containing protein [Thermobispora bispora]MBO2473639.1 DUF305 domain-containing protein [Actinomycetales bacterium]MDI9580910.1 DUF305 domain-containing protein [Thermobispora sp.]ADG89281.1 protein of unknown function DUF305 [Thermobispora bispora DSM 43833]MBX6167227.1 DUF305 domain-containing protein [Thermobispora bispora]QSI48954.1 DUF305 domain-containing protein [Thermobispora bispora]
MPVTAFAAHRIALSAAAALGALALLTACGADTATTAGSGGRAAATRPSATFNEADVRFAQQMIPHHEQAVDMAELAETRAADPEVKELAATIKSTQAAEIALMRRWLHAWSRPEPSGHDGHAGHPMPGMLSDQQMAELEAASGARFDRLFAQLMIAHHKGAIEMARTEQREGANPEAVKLAKDIERGQQAEIDQMERLLQRL